ncbi:cobyric acid synthase [Thermoplasma volcanium]|nr:cobyric acid synthase [Thermoplasma volcanium]
MKMIQVLGTSSGAGKTTVSMALCRILSRQGYSVAPFKAMNMSLNSVIVEGEYEIARAQWLQAIAAKTDPSRYMNPLLLKPEGDGTSQLIVLGKSIGKKGIKEYYDYLRSKGKGIVKESIERLPEKYDVIIAEGAGSPAEINLLDSDIANSFVSSIYGTPAILVGDIDRGGVFASIYGTLMLMPNSELVKWIIINKMRGDVSMLNPGIERLENLISRKVIGILPYQSGFLPGEDSFDYEKPPVENDEICVIRYPFMENYSDVDPLVLSGKGFTFVTEKNINALDNAKLIILPGSKNVPADLEYVKNTGIAEKLSERRGKALILGICGGYQILGSRIDYYGKSMSCLSFLKCHTEYREEKTTRSIRFKFAEGKYWSDGYEIHYGEVINDGEKPMNLTELGYEGCISEDGTVFGTNIHNILGNSDFFLRAVGEQSTGLTARLESSIDAFADTFEKNVNLSEIMEYLEEKSV